jgi:hypothetical protein
MDCDEICSTPTSSSEASSIASRRIAERTDRAANFCHAGAE